MHLLEISSNNIKYFNSQKNSIFTKVSLNKPYSNKIKNLEPRLEFTTAMVIVDSELNQPFIFKRVNGERFPSLIFKSKTNFKSFMKSFLDAVISNKLK